GDRGGVQPRGQRGGGLLGDVVPVLAAGEPGDELGDLLRVGGDDGLAPLGDRVDAGDGDGLEADVAAADVLELEGEVHEVPVLVDHERAPGGVHEGTELPGVGQRPGGQGLLDQL